MEHKALVLNDNDLRKLCKEALRENLKNIDNVGTEKLIAIWNEIGKGYTIEKYSQPNTITELMLNTKNKGKIWLTSIGSVVKSEELIVIEKMAEKEPQKTENTPVKTPTLSGTP